MKVSDTYRLNSTSLAIYSENDLRTPIMIPAGSLITLVCAPLDGLRMVDVMWLGKTVMMFTGDVRNRGTLLSAEEAAKG